MATRRQTDENMKTITRACAIDVVNRMLLVLASSLCIDSSFFFFYHPETSDGGRVFAEFFFFFVAPHPSPCLPTMYCTCTPPRVLSTTLPFFPLPLLSYF